MRVDWKEVAKLSEHEQMRAWVENWKRIGPELERRKRRELRALSEEDAFDEALTLSASSADETWVEPGRAASEGLLEQQRLFQRLRAPK